MLVILFQFRLVNFNYVVVVLYSFPNNLSFFPSLSLSLSLSLVLSFTFLSTFFNAKHIHSYLLFFSCFFFLFFGEALFFFYYFVMGSLCVQRLLPIVFAIPDRITSRNTHTNTYSYHLALYNRKILSRSWVY